MWSVITLISRNFHWKFVRLEFRDFHTVHYGNLDRYPYILLKMFDLEFQMIFYSRSPPHLFIQKQKKGNWNTLKMHDLRPTFLLCAYCATFFFWPQSTGVFTCLILVSIVTILVKCCDNTYNYWVNTWKMWSSGSPLLASIVTILISIEGILREFRSQF